MADRPVLIAEAITAITSFTADARTTALAPTPVPSMRARSTRAMSCEVVPSPSRTSTCSTFAGRPTAWGSSAPRASSPAAVPADEPSMNAGNTLLVPVEIGMITACGAPIATSRHVPSPPSTTIGTQPIASSRVAPRLVSNADPVPSPSTSSPAGTRASARSAMRPASRSTATRSAPASSAPAAIRCTLPTFAASDVWPTGACRRRTSLPAQGLTMMPTVDTRGYVASRGRASASRTPAAIRAGSGTYLVSSAGVNGTGEYGAPTRPTGASR